MKKKISMELKIKNCDKIFSKGFNPGVIATQILEITIKKEEDVNDPFFERTVWEAEEAFIQENMEVIKT